jgi:hypothetical protein
MTYTKTFTLCDNVDIRVHCLGVQLDTECGVEYDEDYTKIELIIGEQAVELEGEIDPEIQERIFKMAGAIDAPDGAYDDEGEMVVLGVDLEDKILG